MIKENLKIKRSIRENNIEAINLFNEIGLNYQSNCFAYLYACDSGFHEKREDYEEITLTELRELARPKEYLNDKFELVVTNRPQDGWRLIPPHMDMLTLAKHGTEHFWNQMRHFSPNGSDPLMNGQYTFNYYKEHYLDKIKWQRNPKQETTMNTEKKGRFLHQEWYELNAKEDIQVGSNEYKDVWDDVTGDTPIRIFNNPDYKFRLKPKTIQIGTHTIVKPIDVKPEIDSYIYVSNPCQREKYFMITWRDNDQHNFLLDSNLCHLTAENAINNTDALLALMEGKS